LGKYEPALDFKEGAVGANHAHGKNWGILKKKRLGGEDLTVCGDFYQNRLVWKVRGGKRKTFVEVKRRSGCLKGTLGGINLPRKVWGFFGMTSLVGGVGISSNYKQGGIGWVRKGGKA